MHIISSIEQRHFDDLRPINLININYFSWQYLMSKMCHRLYSAVHAVHSNYDESVNDFESIIFSVIVSFNLIYCLVLFIKNARIVFSV